MFDDVRGRIRADDLEPRIRNLHPHLLPNLTQEPAQAMDATDCPQRSQDEHGERLLSVYPSAFSRLDRQRPNRDLIAEVWAYPDQEPTVVLAENQSVLETTEGAGLPCGGPAAVAPQGCLDERICPVVREAVEALPFDVVLGKDSRQIRAQRAVG